MPVSTSPHSRSFSSLDFCLFPPGLIDTTCFYSRRPASSSLSG